MAEKLLVKKFLYEHRFGVFLTSLMALISVDLLFPREIQKQVIQFMVIQNIIISTVLFIKKSKKEKSIITVLIVISIINLISTVVFPDFNIDYWTYLVGLVYFVFVSIHLLSDIYKLKKLTREAVFGVFAGFILMAIISGFLFLIVESIVPNSFSGINDKNDLESYMYFSFITLMTIGYGDITPLTDIARKLVITVALIGHFYTVFVAAIVVGKMFSK
ncbi:MAG: ion channel [Bacteroidota bacterium]